MKILKRITAIILATSILLLSGCNNEVKNKENLESVLQNSQSSQESDNSSDASSEERPGGSQRLHFDLENIPTEYNGGELSMTCSVSNGDFPETMGVFIYVNGIQMPCKVNDSEEALDYHVLKFEPRETTDVIFKFTPYNCKKGEKAEILFTTMLNTEFMLPDATYFGFGINHSIETHGPFYFDVNEDGPEKDLGGIFEDVTVTDITKEIEAEYSEKDYLTGEILDCHLDSMTKYELYDKDVYDPFITCDDTLELTARSLGLPQKFYAAIYIDHKLMPAFDGKCYAYFEVDRQHVSTAKVKIDTSQLPEGLHHIYMRVIPVGDNPLGQHLSWKTVTKLLLKGESYIAQAQDTLDKFHAGENNNNQQTESKEESKPSENTNSNLSALDRAVIQNVTKIDGNTLLLRGEKNYVLADADTYEIIKEISHADTVRIQKIDNGFAIINVNDNYDDCSYDIYDVKGNIIKHVDIPNRTIETETQSREYPVIEPVLLCISTDGKKAVYRGVNGFCVNTVDLDNEVVIQPPESFAQTGVHDELYRMSHILLYKDDIVYGKASKYNPDIDSYEFFFASLDTKTKEWTVYCRLDRQWIFMQDDFVDNSFITPYADAYYGFSDRNLPYLLVGDKELRKFTCEEGDESTNAFISPNGKYILTSRRFSDFDAEIKLYDVKTGEVLLKQKTSHSALGAYIDENERKLYVQSGEFLVLDF